MPALFFVAIGLMSGRRGLVDAVYAGMDQKKSIYYRSYG